MDQEEIWLKELAGSAGNRWPDIRLGKDVETVKVVSLSPEARQQHLYVIGQTRTGKTTLLLNIALQDLEDREAGLCLLDLHGDVRLDLLERIPEDREDEVILGDATCFAQSK